MFEVEGFGFCEMCDQTVEGESDGVQADMPALRQWGTHLDDAPFRRHRGVALRGMSADSHTRGLGAMTDNMMWTSRNSVRATALKSSEKSSALTAIQNMVSRFEKIFQLIGVSY